jgi:hypothetical protein
MATGKRKPNAPARRTAKGARRGPAGPAAGPTTYTSAGWERVFLLSLELTAVAHDLGLPKRAEATEGFDVADAARELGRLASNYDRTVNPAGRNAEREREDWVAVGGLGADLGNMADEGAAGPSADAVRAVAYELCYLACDYLF